MSSTIGGVRIVDMPDLGAVNDTSSVVGEHAGSGRFATTALRDYVTNYVTSLIGVVSVKAYGAKGDGTTDDTTAIRAAINSLATRPAILVFPAGTYLCTPSTFTNISNSEIRGVGRYGAVVKFTAGGTGWTFSNSQELFLQHLAFYGTGVTAISGVCFTAGSGVNTVDNCYFANFDTDGLQIFGSSTVGLSGHRVANCIFLQCMQKQLHLLYANDFWIEGNQYGVSSTSVYPAYGCYMDNANAGTYSQNYHWNNTVGFYCINGNYLRIENNRFEESQQEGVHLGTGVNIILTGNTLHTNAQAGTAGTYNQAAFTGIQGIILDGNQVFDWNGVNRAANGFAFGTGCTALTIRGNQARNYVAKPFFLDPSLASISIAADASFACNSRTTIAAGGGDFIGPPGSATGGGFSVVEVPVGRATCAVSILAESNLAPGAGQSFGYTLIVNGTSAGLTCSTAGTLFTSASSNIQAALSPTDSLCVQVTTSAGAAVTTHRVVVMLADY